MRKGDLVVTTNGCFCIVMENEPNQHGYMPILLGNGHITSVKPDTLTEISFMSGNTQAFPSLLDGRDHTYKNTASDKHKAMLKTSVIALRTLLRTYLRVTQGIFVTDEAVNQIIEVADVLDTVREELNDLDLKPTEEDKKLIGRLRATNRPDMLSADSFIAPNSIIWMAAVNYVRNLGDTSNVLNVAKDHSRRVYIVYTNSNQHIVSYNKLKSLV